MFWFTNKLKKSQIQLANFDTWIPKDYLQDYYSKVEQDERYTLEFLVSEYRKIKQSSIVLEFGIGPTLHHLLPLAPYVAEIHVCDYLEQNLNEVERWIKKEKGCHNWSSFTKLVLEYEGEKHVTDEMVQEREDIVRSKITKIFKCDANEANPLAPVERKYDVIVSCYCADSATTDKSTWQRYMKNIIYLVNAGGYFISTALRECQFYRVGEKLYPCVNITEVDFLNTFEKLDFDLQTVNIIVKEVPEHRNVGYESIILSSGYKKS